MRVEANGDERDRPVERISIGERSGEEEQGLLREWKEEVDDGDQYRNRDLRRRTVVIWTATVSFTLLVVLVIAGFLFIHGGNISSTSSQMQSNDYILDPAWNYDAPPQRREFTWTVKDHMHNPDGIYRPMMLVNDQFPGPLIEANEGDTIIVQVHNQAANATSIHWHGIYQNGTNSMDGTVGITQCPIPPGGTFKYEFTIKGQSGSYWWHGHYGVQSSDGLHGPLIVHARNERQLQQTQYTTDRVILVSDHYHDVSSALLWQYLKPDMENAEPVPNAALLNGRAIQNCDLFPNRKCENSSSHVGVPRFDLDPGQNHRIRFINVGAFAEFQIQIDEHELAVTEVDGTDVVPTKYHRLNISPAQRYSVVVQASVSGAGSFWLRARMVTKCFTNPPHNLQSEVRGIVRYYSESSHSTTMPVSRDWQEVLDMDCKDMNSSDLRPVEKVDVPVKADAFFYLRSNFEIGAYRLSRGFFNASSWRPDIRSPSLYRTIDGMKVEDASFAAPATSSIASTAAFVNEAAFDNSRELVVQTTGIQTIDILVSNFDDGNHPLHLHGYKYFVLAQGHGYPQLAYVGADIKPENLKPLYDSLDLTNPLRRDTASVEAFGWILLRVVADNPGIWAFHCHLSWHSEAGLLMQFLTRSDELAKMEVPHVHREMCSSLGIEKGKGPEDADYEDLAK